MPAALGPRGEPGKRSSLLELLESKGIPWGQEDSFKFEARRLLKDRVLVGINARHLSLGDVDEFEALLAMPAGCRTVLAPVLARANAIFFGIEERAEGAVCKMYLEFWDEVRMQVLATETTKPLLLHLGVKWSADRPEHHEVACYQCHPLLGTRDILRRMAAVYPGGTSSTACSFAHRVVQEGLKRSPSASLLYEEVSESGNPRRSFDVNLYKTGLRVADVAKTLAGAADHFGIGRPELDAVLEPFRPRLLGHLSGGIGRHGQEFLSVYAEVKPLPSD